MDCQIIVFFRLFSFFVKQPGFYGLLRSGVFLSESRHSSFVERFSSLVASNLHFDKLSKSPKSEGLIVLINLANCATHTAEGSCANVLFVGGVDEWTEGV